MLQAHLIDHLVAELFHQGNSQITEFQKQALTDMIALYTQAIQIIRTTTLTGAAMHKGPLKERAPH